MFYLLVAAQLTILFTIAALGWVKLNASFRSYDVRWVFSGLACLLFVGLAIVTGCIYFEYWSPPYPFKQWIFVSDEPARLELFIASCVATLVLFASTIVGLRRTDSGIFAPSRARAWHYRRLIGFFAATLLTLTATVAANDWSCRRELASWRAEGERLLDDLATRYPPVGDRETALEQYARLVEQSRITDKSLNAFRTAIQKGLPPPPFPKQGESLLRSMKELQPTPRCNLRTWLDKELLDDVAGGRLGDIEDVLMWRLMTADPEHYWPLMRMWSEIVERLARDPTPRFDEWLMGAETRMTKFLHGAILKLPIVVRTLRATSWVDEPDYFANLADRLQWMEARNLLLMSDVGLARYEHPPYHELWMFLPNQRPAVSADVNAGIEFRMRSSFWKETKPYHDGIRRIRRLAALPAEKIPRAVLAEYGRSPTVDEQRAQGIGPDALVLDIPLMDEIFFDSIFRRTQACMLRRITKVSLACAAFALEKGTPPEGLSDLVPKYLTEIPTDPYSGRPYCFIRNKNAFKVYSIDINCRDDGGAFTGTIDGDCGWEFVVQNGAIQAK